MSHITTRSSYKKLIDRLDLFPQSAPVSDTLFQILKILFSEKEAELISYLPIKPFTAKKAAKIWKRDVKDAQAILVELASRAMILDIGTESGPLFVIPPPMAGFFEFSLMRLKPGDKDQKALGELFYQYLNVEEDFVKDLFGSTETQLGRIYANEPAISKGNSLHVLDYEKASYIIKTASHIGVGACYCRHKMMHVGKNCNVPIEDICLTFNASAYSLIKYGHIKQITVKEGMDILHKTYDYNLVQFGENVQQGVNFICNCCGCCCEALLAARKFGFLNAVYTTNFIPEINEEKCNGCGKCVTLCPVEAMTLVSANDPEKTKKKKARLFENICLGCGVCINECKTGAVFLKNRNERVITPVDSAHRTVLMAIEKGKLQNLIFDNQAHLNHRVMAAILGVILNLPPLKRKMASKQLKSSYLNNLLGSISPKINNYYTKYVSKGWPSF